MGKTTWGEKHPILSGVEICHKHIPDPILTSSKAISILVNSEAYPQAWAAQRSADITPQGRDSLTGKQQGIRKDVLKCLMIW